MGSCATSSASSATSSANSLLITGPSQNRLQNVSCLSQLHLWLIFCLFLWPHCVEPFQAALFFCRQILCAPVFKKKHLWQVLLLLPYSRVMEFALFWHLSHSLLPWAFKSALKTHLYEQYHSKWFQTCFLICMSTPPCSLLVTFLLCARVCAWVWLYNYCFWGFNVHFCWSCKAWCAHPCQWDVALK